jgi:hypothetical protein
MKYTAYINYSADIEGIIFESFELETDHHLIESLILNMSGDRKKIILEFSVNTDSIEQARELSQETSDKVINGLRFFYNAKVGKLSSGQKTLEVLNDDGSKTPHIYAEFTESCGVSVTLTRHLDQLDPRLIALVNSDDQKNFLYNQFGFAMQIDDPVARYMLLYSILLQTKGDWQKEVDRFILNKEPKVETFQPPEKSRPPKSPPQDETIYTKLRNEIGHVREGATFKETCQEIESKVKGLEHLTRLAIEEFRPLE